MAETTYQAQPRYTESKITRIFEEQTAKLPADFFLWGALGSIGASLMLQLFGKRHLSMFVGQWAPTFVALGLYRKLVKVSHGAGNGYERREEA